MKSFKDVDVIDGGIFPTLPGLPNGALAHFVSM